jgi:hypothetical protein
MKGGFRSFIFRLGALAIVLGISGLPGTRNSDLAHAAGGAALPPAAPVAAMYQPLNEQLEVFIVDANGALNVVWKDNNGSWKAPFPLTRANFTIPGASVAAIYYPTYQQLEVFVVDKNGVLNVVWKDHNGAWHAPVGLTDPGFAPPGAPLAAVYQPLNEQLEVFVVGASGALNVVWKDNNGIWKRPFALTGAAFATPGAHVAGAYYPSYKQLEVFLLDKNGVFNAVWKANNGPWHSPVGLSPLGFARQGAPLTAIYQPLNEQLEVLTVDSRGAINVIWKEHNGPWHAPVGLTGVDSINVGSALTGIHYPPNEQLEVFFIDKLGAFDVLWKEHNSEWKGPVGVTEPHFVPGAPVAAVFYPRYDQLEAFTTDKDGVLNVEWKVRNQAWVPCSFPLLLTPRGNAQILFSKTPTSDAAGKRSDIVFQLLTPRGNAQILFSKTPIGASLFKSNASLFGPGGVLCPLRSLILARDVRQRLGNGLPLLDNLLTAFITPVSLSRAPHLTF